MLSSNVVINGVSFSTKPEEPMNKCHLCFAPEVKKVVKSNPYQYHTKTTVTFGCGTKYVMLDKTCPETEYIKVGKHCIK